MTEFLKSDPASIAEFATATRTPLVYEMIPANKVGEKYIDGWRPLSPFVAMVPPQYVDFQK